jgi:hypothetical protein
MKVFVQQCVKRLLGGGKKEAEAPPKVEVLNFVERYNVGPEGSDTSAKRRSLIALKYAKEDRNKL